jgi:hypothetical protein
MLHPPQVHNRNHTASTPPEKISTQTQIVNGKNLLLRETRAIWRHLGLPDREEPRATPSRLPVEETTSLQGLRLIDG